MPARALIEVDLRIALLRDESKQRKASPATAREMKELLRKRGELIQKMIAERAGEIRAGE